VRSSIQEGALGVEKQVGSAPPTVYIFLGMKVIAEYSNGAARAASLRFHAHNLCP
jgi:hypothetical protein